VESGNTVLVVEHNLEVIQAADWVIDMGPEAGEGGGRIVVEGPPEDVVIHAQRWRNQQKTAGKEAGTAAGKAAETAATKAAADEPLLRSHTGEALETFGRTRPAAGAAGKAGAGEPAAPTTAPRGRSSRRAGARSRCD
jgi:hypothetical protein